MPVAPIVASLEPDQGRHVPQCATNLRELEDVRQFSDGLEKDLVTQRFKIMADKPEDVIAAYPPDVLFKHDGFTTAAYGAVKGYFLESMGWTFVVEKEGKLVYSFHDTCIRHPIFFDGLTEAERQLWWVGYRKELGAYAANLAPLKQRQLAGMTVGGPAAAAVFVLLVQRAAASRSQFCSVAAWKMIRDQFPCKPVIRGAVTE